MLENLLLIAHLVLTVAIIVLVLLQQGKGAQAGAAFGGGSSQSLFGARGSANFLTRSTSLVVVLFFTTTLVLAYLYTHRGEGGGSVVGDPVLEGSVLQGALDEAATTVELGSSEAAADDAGVPQIPDDAGVMAPKPDAQADVPQVDVPQVDVPADAAPTVPE